MSPKKQVTSLKAKRLKQVGLGGWQTGWGYKNPKVPMPCEWDSEDTGQAGEGGETSRQVEQSLPREKILEASYRILSR
jgi:hypothetical protein